MTRNRQDSRYSARRWKKPLAILGFSAAALGIGWAAVDAALQPAPLETLIPEYVPGFAAVDAARAWDITADLRATTAARKTLASMEKDLHVSLEEDVLPWAGQVAVAPLGFGIGKHPDLAVLVEVRNPVQYYLTMARLRTRLEQAATPYWKGTGYHGVPLRYGYVGQGRNRVPVSTAWLDGWLVVGVGNGSAKRVIDAAQGRKRTLATNTAWASTLDKVPADNLVRYGINLGQVYRHLPLPGVPKEFVEQTYSVMTAGVAETEDGLRSVMAMMPTSPAALQLARKAGRTLPPAPVGLMDRLPDDAFVSVASGNLSVWWEVYEPMFARLMAAGGPAPPAARKELQPVGDILRRLTGGVALGVGYGADTGWGAVVVGDAGTAESARGVSDDIANFVEAHGGMVEEGEQAGAYSLPSMSSSVPFAPSWNTDEQYLHAASNKGWLAAPATGAHAGFTSNADGAQVVARGNFAFVSPLLEKAGALPVAKAGVPKSEDIEKGWRATGLESARWFSWSHVAEDGASTGGFEIVGWPWREALRAAVAGK